MNSRFDLALGRDPPPTAVEEAPQMAEETQREWQEGLVRESRRAQQFQQEYLGSWTTNPGDFTPAQWDQTANDMQRNCYRMLVQFVSTPFPPYFDQLRVNLPNTNVRDIVNFKKEHQTLRVAAPRRFGKTTIAIMLLYRFQDAIIATANAQLGEAYRSRFRQRWVNLNGRRPDNFGLVRPVSAAIADEAQFLDPIQETVFYSINTDKYILLG